MIYTFLDAYQSTPPLHRLIARISSLAIKTGVIPCVYALISLVTYVSHVDQNIVSFFTYMLGRVYTLSMLFSLIYRDKLVSDGELINMDSTLPSSITCEWDRYTFFVTRSLFQIPVVSNLQKSDQSPHPEPHWDDGT